MVTAAVLCNHSWQDFAGKQVCRLCGRQRAPVKEAPPDYSREWKAATDIVPRHTKVIVQAHVIDNVQGIALSSKSIESKKFVVYAVGPEVKDLAVGDHVMMTGQEKVDWSWLPGFSEEKLLIIDEANVLLVYKPKPAGPEPAKEDPYEAVSE